ncbi:tyrosine-type recombinase/integrase [Parasphingorhabdus pacifica]
MPALDLDKLLNGLSTTWSGFLRDWDRSLRSVNRPETTRYNYVLAATQLARFLKEHSPDPDADDAADDPTEVTKDHIEAFQAWMVETRSASTAVNKHKTLRVFFGWLVNDEEELARSPLDKVRKPKTPSKLVPVLEEDYTTRLLQACSGRDFLSLRDQALIRLFANTGARLSEVAGLTLDDIDLKTESVIYRGKGAKDRRVRISPRTTRTLSRYVRARSKRNGAHLPDLWLADRGAKPLHANGIKIRLKRLGNQVGIKGLHAHRWRHTYAHEWKTAGGDTGDLMLTLGWSSETMVRHYGASAAAERAHNTQTRLNIGDHR